MNNKGEVQTQARLSRYLHNRRVRRPHRLLQGHDDAVRRQSIIVLRMRVGYCSGAGERFARAELTAARGHCGRLGEQSGRSCCGARLYGSRRCSLPDHSPGACLTLTFLPRLRALAVQAHPTGRWRNGSCQYSTLVRANRKPEASLVCRPACRFEPQEHRSNPTCAASSFVTFRTFVLNVDRCSVRPLEEPRNLKKVLALSN